MEDKTTITVRLDDDDLEKLKKIAKDEKESQSSMIRRLIRQKFDANSPPSKFVSSMRK